MGNQHNTITYDSDIPGKIRNAFYAASGKARTASRAAAQKTVSAIKRADIPGKADAAGAKILSASTALSKNLSCIAQEIKAQAAAGWDFRREILAEDAWKE